MQLHIISQPVKSSQNIILQEFMRLIINDGERIAQNETWVILGSIMKAEKVLTNGFTFTMKPLLNGGDLEKSRLPSNDSMACYLPTLYTNHESLCLPNQWKKSPGLTKELHHKSLQTITLYIYLREALLLYMKYVILHCLR